MKINFNISAIIANNALADSDNSLTASLERLSSGLKINHAKDNPAGLAIAKRMNAQIEGLAVATQNASDGISIIETAEGALAEIQSMFQRMTELSVKAATETYGPDDKQYMQDEVNELNKEIDRIAKQTEFNGQSLLDGSFASKAYANVTGIEVTSYSDIVTNGKYEITVDQLATFDADGNVLTDAQVTIKTTPPDNFPKDARATCTGNEVVITASGGFEMKIELSPTPQLTANLGNPALISVTGVGSMRLQIGANEGQIINMNIPKVSLDTLGIRDINLTDRPNALKAMTMVREANEMVSQVRSRLGAYQNRLEHSIASLDVTSENMTAAYSRIMDVDMATEMTEYTKLQVMTQAGTSMLAQANERPQQVLQLLQ